MTSKPCETLSERCEQIMQTIEYLLEVSSASMSEALVIAPYDDLDDDNPAEWLIGKIDAVIENIERMKTLAAQYTQLKSEIESEIAAEMAALDDAKESD